MPAAQDLVHQVGPDIARADNSHFYLVHTNIPLLYKFQAQTPQAVEGYGEDIAGTGVLGCRHGAG
ncbi:hypothetical protein MTAT_30090 [Moorella thermoacetica]|uniref:Uncharacterized protein n=1 Tax=Neomoorella thermoacetica TaxID=1525 RepID=A0ABY3N226_NEOTH|nr:hypothetical protein MTAT_30090 [Moorella thermoacetica]